MKAIVLTTPGAPDQLKYVELAKPEITAGEVLVKVKAISINPVDVKSRAGKGFYGTLKNQDPLILGWDISGEVVESLSESFKTGDQVFGMVNFPGHGKAYAEYVAVPANQLALKPSNIAHAEAAAATLVALTAWQAIVTNANVQKGQQVLIHAAAGGVGHFAVQIAKYLGAIVTGTSSAHNKEFVLALGADEHIDYHNYDWSLQGRRYDFVLDALGGESLDQSIGITKKGGSIITIPGGVSEATLEKAKANEVNAYFVLVQSNGADMNTIASLLERDIIKSHVSKTYSFGQMKEAHLQVETGRTVGKVVVLL
jgi:NADPH:quinone reductase-like Zn-dependent oxidoreductase